MIIVIKPDGEIELKTVGMKGTECDEELKSMEDAFGFKSKTYTSERHEKPVSKIQKKSSSTK